MPLACALLKVINSNGLPGWVQCLCPCGNYRGAKQEKPLREEVTACAGCTARIKVEGVKTGIGEESRPD